MNSVEKINKAIVSCRKCPRLLSHCQKIALLKKRAYHLESYWGKPVPGFGDKKARLWIVGLAPGAHGANRTGRVFTGDSSGNWLYRALYNVGMASQPNAVGLNDGLKLKNTYISCVARCAPPQNKLKPKEILSCEPFLKADYEALSDVDTILALGNMAFQAVQKLLKVKPRFKFKHGATFHVESMRLVTSYHPSQQNTHTGKLTWDMWEKVFWDLKKALENKSLREGNFIASHRTDGFNEPHATRTS